MNYTISALAKKFGLSRSTLLYYDAIGLLSPRTRSTSNYRVYTEHDVVRMKEIAELRGTGIALRNIRTLLNARTTRRRTVLRRRMQEIAREINALRTQQRSIVSLLGNKEIACSTHLLTKEKWITYLRAAGLDEAGMRAWHEAFETSSPDAHQDFLESLGLSAPEIHAIRQHSRRRKKTSA